MTTRQNVEVQLTSPRFDFYASLMLEDDLWFRAASQPIRQSIVQLTRHGTPHGAISAEGVKQGVLIRLAQDAKKG